MAGDPRAAATPAEDIDRLEGPRREEMQALDAMIREELPALRPHVRDGMLAYGAYHYEYASGRSGDSSVVALAGHGAKLSLHVMCTVDDGYLAEAFAPRLPRADVGRSCCACGAWSTRIPASCATCCARPGATCPTGVFGPASPQPS